MFFLFTSEAVVYFQSVKPVIEMKSYTKKRGLIFFFLCLRHALVLFLISLFPLSVVSTPHVVARETRLDVVQ